MMASTPDESCSRGLEMEAMASEDDVVHRAAGLVMDAMASEDDVGICAQPEFVKNHDRIRLDLGSARERGDAEMASTPNESCSQGLAVDGMASEDDVHSQGLGMDPMGSDDDVGLGPEPHVLAEQKHKKPKLDPEGGKVKDREEWSDGAISSLLDAYEEKYTKLDRGHLKGRDWEEVSSVVNGRCGAQKTAKGVMNCKYKMDTLKRRYKVEKDKKRSSGSMKSRWPWYARMEQLVEQGGDKMVAAEGSSAEDEDHLHPGTSDLPSAEAKPKVSQLLGFPSPAVKRPYRKRAIERGISRALSRSVRYEHTVAGIKLDPRTMTQGERESYELFDLGDFPLNEGATLRGAKLAYKTWGSLNEDSSNAILYPTWYSGRHWENDWLIGPTMTLDPSKYFIIVPNMFGNGLSTSPSNCSPPYNQARFPKVTVEDNVRAQYKLVVEKFGIRRLKLVLGWAMGAGQTFQWAVSYPDMMERILPFCGSARTSPHSVVMLEGVKAALTADIGFQDGWYKEIPSKGLRAAARVYAGWGFSQAFYWNELWRDMGYTSLEDCLIGYWEGFFLDRRDPNNLLTMLWTWANGNVGLTPGFDGNLEKALASIKAKAIVISAERDLYFPPQDEAYEVKFIPNAEFRVMPGLWGHFAGAGINPIDTKYIDQVIRELLAT
ncbi:homoserine O-acetyltransferase/O-succinyltransferase [Marchantia polymorpha subsp. ruderalis]|uniref:AB hydrolase-1 domain-containing protein n=2 Tax=Marchantia polymorpha TaxID=3197 RepID=A0AAF6B334_MARPO|nr:hypothetical protein MARPO_0159s0028 [Marchantia polymorpha]BBN06418.1 hypothetical protein Mp_3g20980 [Marchantia polymorpha subsp. ruderalis]|eukprot:PTQ28614.1 hypothetical protein MARPO_0159s0028 [Marchantia polymorpha]